MDFLRAALVADTEVAEERGQWWNPELQWRAGATQFSVAEGMGPATSAWAADECNRVWGQGLSGEEDKLHDERARAAEFPELDARQ